MTHEATDAPITYIVLGKQVHTGRDELGQQRSGMMVLRSHNQWRFLGLCVGVRVSAGWSSDV